LLDRGLFAFSGIGTVVGGWLATEVSLPFQALAAQVLLAAVAAALPLIMLGTMVLLVVIVVGRWGVKTL
jgi:hypothetical protein